MDASQSPPTSIATMTMLTMPASTLSPMHMSQNSERRERPLALNIEPMTGALPDTSVRWEDRPLSSLSRVTERADAL